MSISSKLMGVTKGVPVGIEYVGSATYAQYSNPITFSSGAISGLNAGDILLIFVSNDTTDNLSIPFGWTQQYYNGGFNGTSTVAVYSKVASSSTDTAVSITGGAGGSPAVVMLAFRNASFSSVIFSSATNNPSSVSCSDGDSAVITCYYQDVDNKATISSPSGYTEADEAYVYFSANLSSGIWTGYKTNLTAPSENPEAISVGSLGPPDLHGVSVVILSET